MVKSTRLRYTAYKRNARTGAMEWWYRHGRIWSLLPGDPGKDPEAAKAYWAALTGAHQRKMATTFNTLMESYRASPRWQALAPRTRKDYGRVMDYIAEKIGTKSVLQIERKHVIKAQQENGERPRFANYIVQVLSILMEHAIDLGWRRDNPAHKVKLLRTGEGYRPWPRWAIEGFRREASGPLLTAFELCLGTGQRIGDVLKMRWDQIEGDGIKVVQSKTGKVQTAGGVVEEIPLWIPFTEHLRDYLAALPRTGLTIVCNEIGRPMSYRALEHRLRAPREAAGAKAYSFHGLRYNAASELYEAGCSDAQVQAITGHRSVVQARKYGKGARQRVLAREARDRLK